MNVAMDKDDAPVIFGETLSSGGTPGWIDEDFGSSAAHHDVSALRKLEVWLEERRREGRIGRGAVRFWNDEAD